MGWGQRVLKSASRKNSQLLSTWPCTIVRKRREGRMDGQTDGAREQGGYRGRGVGGQRLKLHHKSHPERKHWVTPPPPIHPLLSPLSPAAWPSPLLLPCISLPSLCFSEQSAPWTNQVYFILLLHVLQTPNSPISPHPLSSWSTTPSFLFPPSISLL